MEEIKFRHTLPIQLRFNDVDTGLAVADDQLTLTAADGEHGVDGQNTGVQRGVQIGRAHV